MNGEQISLLQRLLRIGYVRPAASMAFVFLVSVIAALGLPGVTINVASSQWVPADEPARQTYLHVAREFGSDNRTFIYVRDEQLWTVAKLQSLERLHQQLRQLPFVERIDDIFSTRVVRSIDGQLQTQALLSTAPDDVQGAERVQADALGDPIAIRNLVSADGKALAIGLAVREREDGSGGAANHAALEKILAPLRPQFAELVQVGPARIEAELQRSLLKDMQSLAPALVLAFAVVTLLSFRSLAAAILPVIVAAISLLWAFGMMGLAGIPASMLSVLLPALAMLGASETLRMSHDYFAGLNPAATPALATDRDSAIRFMAGRLGAPVLLTALTLTLGFASNAWGGITAFRDFALVAAFVAISSGLITVLVVPRLLATFGPMTTRHFDAGKSGRLALLATRALGALRQRPVLWGLVLATLVFGGFVQQASRLHLANDPLSFFRPDNPITQAAGKLHADLAGGKVFYITLDANIEGAFRDPARLQRLVEIQAFIAKQQVFDRSLSLADVVAQANQAASGGRPEAYRVPLSRNLVGQYLLLHPKEDLEPYVSHDFRRANIVVRHNIGSSSTLNRHVRELSQAVAHFAGANMVTGVVGENLLINDAAHQLLKSQAWLLLALLLFVFMLVSLMFTSLRGGAIALVPSMVPLLVLFGLMRIFEIPLSLGSALVVVVTVGMATEGAIRLFSRYSDLCRSVASYDDAVTETVRSEATPIIVSRLALAACFSVLVLSDFAPVAQFGALAALAMLLSIVSNLLITPLVMSRIRLVGLYEILALSMQREALERSPLFHGMTDYQIRKTILISELREYQDGECLLAQGTVGRSMYIVVSGQIEVVRQDGNGAQRLAVLGPGEVFGEIGFVHETYRTADVRALGAVAVLRFDHKRLKRDLALFPHIMAKLNFNISGILGKRLAELVEASQPAPPSAPQ